MLIKSASNFPIQSCIFTVNLTFTINWIQFLKIVKGKVVYFTRHSGIISMDEIEYSTAIYWLNVHLAWVNLHDASSCFLVWRRKFNLTVKSTGTQKCRIQDINSVSSSYHLPQCQQHRQIIKPFYHHILYLHSTVINLQNCIPHGFPVFNWQLMH